MSLNSQYHKIISFLTLVVMFWNIFGWLGAGLIVNHMHSQNGDDYCEISFCSCEVEDGNAYCSCHHPELHHKNDGETEEMVDHHSESNPDNEFCFYSSPHPINNNPGDALLAFAKFNALVESQVVSNYSLNSETYLDFHPPFISSEYHAQLLRPPRS